MIHRLPPRARQALEDGGGIHALVGFAVLSKLRAAGLVVMAGALADGISSLAGHTDGWKSALAWGLGAAVARGGLAWATRVFATRSALRSKQALRRELATRLLRDGTSRVGTTTILGTHGLDELDNYYRSVLPSLTNAAIIPLVIGGRLLLADWTSAVIVAITITLVPLFMALIGMHTNEKVAGATAALARLSDHLVELARGLPVLIGLGRAEEQARALEDISDDYRVKTMKSLRVAFLSSLALELISTISVAVVAVFIGFRLVNGELSLDTALLVLILAPECFAPFRDLGAAFHASREGLAALRGARSIIDAPATTSIVTDGSNVGGIRVDDLSVRFADRASATLEYLSFSIPAGQIMALRGASGSGKSTVLGILAGSLADGEEAVVSGRVLGLDSSRIAWVPQDPRFFGETVLDELRTFAGDGPDADARAQRIAVDLDLARLVNDSPNQLSPGEARRLAFARAHLRVQDGASVLLLDEPTAHLDEWNSRVIEGMIADLCGRTTIVLASHDAAIVGLARTVIDIGDPSGLRQAVGSGSPDPQRGTAVGVAPMVAETPGSTLGIRTLRVFLRPALGRYVGAVALGSLAALFAMSLTAVSGWLIVRASEHPAVMYLMVAIVGVRFFGIGRSALHYVERLVTHDAVFESVTSLRVRLWRSLIARGATSRKSLAGSTVLDQIVGAADQVRDLAPRVLIPAAVGVATSAAVLITVALLHAPAVPLVVGLIFACLVLAPAVTLVADRAANVRLRRAQSVVLRKFAALVGAVADIRGNGVSARVADDIADADATAGRESGRSTWALGLGSGIIVFACCAAAVLSFVVAAPAVLAGTLPIEIVAVLAFIPLGMIEPMLAALEAIQLWPALAFSLRRTAFADATVAPTATVRLERGDAITDLEFSGLAATWPGADAPAFSGLDARMRVGEWLTIEGPSGSGKSTLLTVLLGHLPPSSGTCRINGRDASELDATASRSRIAWAPQDGYLFDSTLRANLLLARPRGDAPSEAEMLGVLRRVGLAGLVDGLVDGLDARVGAGGSRLSGGQRQRVVIARTLLARADVVLLDEPTAHLDAESAADLMADLRLALAGKIVVLITHQAEDVRPTDARLDLSPARFAELIAA